MDGAGLSFRELLNRTVTFRSCRERNSFSTNTRTQAEMLTLETNGFWMLCWQAEFAESSNHPCQQTLRNDQEIKIQKKGLGAVRT